MLKRVFFWLIIIVAIFPSTVFAAENGDGVIEGRLINGTGDADGSVANLEVSLGSYIGSVKQEDVVVALTDDSGVFQFTGLATDLDRSYDVSINYLGVDYLSDLISFPEGEKSLPVELSIFETTDNEPTLSIPQSHIIVSIDEDTLFVREVIFVSNSSDRTYVGKNEVGSEGNKETLRFSVPAQAINIIPGLELIDSFFLSRQKEIIDTDPVVPGTTRMDYSYSAYTYPHPLR